MKWTRYSMLALAGAMTVNAGCEPGGGQTDQPEGIQNRLVLESFRSCGELESYIEETALRDMRLQLDALKDRTGGRGGEGPPILAGAEDAANKSSGPSAYTTTNTQVAGVDEADFMKNDGTRIFVLSGGTLYASKSWPPADMALVGKLTVEGYPTEMFLDEKKNRVVVFSSVWTKYRADEVEPGRGGAPCIDWGCGYGYSNTTKVTVVDVSRLDGMRVTAEHYLPGSYSNSRRIDSSVRVVLADQFRWPSKVKWYPDYDPTLWNDPARFAAAVDKIKAENEALIRAQSLTDWLPRSKRRAADGTLVEVPYSCGDFSKSNAPVRLGLLTVATLNLDGGDDVRRTSIVGQPGEIYASQSALYVATRHWWWWPLPGQTDYTYLHKFDITDPDRARYVASGGVEGHIVDQFSMDEHKGFFRVATTVSRRVPDPKNPQNRWGLIETTNRISVLGENAGRLRLQGQSEDVSKGERIFSARFLGDRGFIVTFRQVDPLHSFDLSDPSKPREVGQLKVPGFSTYLHPVKDNNNVDRYLLALGVYMPEPDANGQVNWQERRMKLTLFDVSDLGNPQEKANLLVGTAYGWSEAAHEHKAFNYFAQRKLLAIPFSDYRHVTGPNYWDSFVSELRVFGVDPTPGRERIFARGAMNMRDVYQTYGDRDWTWYWSPWIRRSVMATDDANNDYVYSVSDGGLRVSHLDRLASPLATVRFDKARK
jgi:hypothetical protein